VVKFWKISVVVVKSMNVIAVKKDAVPAAKKKMFRM
jgi:hypothetical protein